MAVTTTGLLIAGLITSVVGTGVAVYSNIQAGKAARAIGDANAALDQQQAQVDIDQSQTQAQAIRDRNKRTASTQRATFLKSGITLEGTAQDVMYDSALQGELEALDTEYQGKVASQFSTKRSYISKYEGRSRQTAAYGAAAGSLLSGVGNALSIMANPKFPGRS